MTTHTVLLSLDVCGILAVAVMLYLTEKPMTTIAETTKDRIYAMLNDAKQNDYDVSTWTVDDIVADLLAYADLRDDETEDVIRPHVITWKMARTEPT